MSEGKRRAAARAARTLALVLAGMLAGSLMVGPATAHLGGSLTVGHRHLINKHLKKFFYTKNQIRALIGETKVVVDATAALETTNSTSFVDVPGATTTITVPSRTTGLIHATFSAESACYGAANNCSVRILIGGTEANPPAGLDFAFDTNVGGDNPGTAFTGEAHSMQRYRPDLAPGTYDVRVQYAVAGAGTTAQLDDWTLSVERLAT